MGSIEVIGAGGEDRQGVVRSYMDGAEDPGKLRMVLRRDREFVEGS